MPRKPPEQVDVEDVIGPDSTARIPWAGLLADQPNLRTELHTRQEWQELLAAYNASERI